MLQYRLSDTQLRDLTAFLLDEYRTSGGTPDATPAAYEDPQAVAAGRATFIRRGCPSCHHIAGVPDPGRIGPNLAGVADRDPAQLQYGAAGVRRTTDNYIFLKVLHPDALLQPSLMPTFDFEPGQAARITLALAGLRSNDLPASFVENRPPVAPYRPAGAFGALVERYRCLSCHSIGGFGGTLSTVPLDRIGSQLQHDYLVGYLLNPGAVRVSVEARMPVFHMLPDEARTIADYASLVFLDDAFDAYDARFTPADVQTGAGPVFAAGLCGLPPDRHERRLRRAGSLEQPAAPAARLGGRLAAGRPSATSRARSSRITACPPPTPAR